MRARATSQLQQRWLCYDRLRSKHDGGVRMLKAMPGKVVQLAAGLPASYPPQM